MSEAIFPAADFLVNFREQIANGKSIYGDPASPTAQAKLAELDAKIGLGRQLGEIAARARALVDRTRGQRALEPGIPGW